jgi:hypothetical protein
MQSQISNRQLTAPSDRSWRASPRRDPSWPNHDESDLAIAGSESPVSDYVAAGKGSCGRWGEACIAAGLRPETLKTAGVGSYAI